MNVGPHVGTVKAPDDNDEGEYNPGRNPVVIGQTVCSDYKGPNSECDYTDEEPTEHVWVFSITCG